MNLTDIRHLFDYTEWANDLATSMSRLWDQSQIDFRYPPAHCGRGLDLVGTMEWSLAYERRSLVTLDD
jgi:hypothetical protein